MTHQVDGSDITVQYHKRNVWKEENSQYTCKHHRLQKAARLVNKLAHGKSTTLLDLGCGPATLARLVAPNIEYYGVDIAIHNPAPNLLEADLLENPIGFDGKRFDIVLAQGFFEYSGVFQAQKFAEIATILNERGTFIVSYVNFGHRARVIYHLYNNVQSINEFRASLGERFEISRSVPTSHNWSHSEPTRKVVSAINMHVNTNIPVISNALAVEYFFICSPR